MAKRSLRPKSAQNAKSSPEARRLLRASLRRHKTYRGVAKALGLSNHMQAVRMLKGEIRDTPEMKAAIVRANTRAKRAWSFEKLVPANCVDPAHLRNVINDLSRLVETLRALTPKEGERTNENNLQGDV